MGRLFDDSVAIVGMGAVGRGMQTLFSDAVVFDEPLGIGTREAVNACRFAFVCVPTPSMPSGAADTRIVEAVVGWVQSETIVLRSTVPPGTTDRIASATGKRVVFQPEYGPGSTPGHPYADVRNIGWAILGGPPEWTQPVHDLYRRTHRADLDIRQTDAVTAELAKYMENAFLALKVTFCNEFYDLAGALGVDYETLRDLWLLDPRMGESHTLVYPDDRGFGGPCLPKDLAAIVARAAEAGTRPTLLRAVLDVNEELRRRGPGA